MKQRINHDVRILQTLKRQAIPLLALAIVALATVAPSTDHATHTKALLWAFSSIIMWLWLIWIFIVQHRQSDELQQLQQLRCAAIGFGATLSILTVVSILDGLHVGNSHQFLQIAFVGGVATWIVATTALSKRG